MKLFLLLWFACAHEAHAPSPLRLERREPVTRLRHRAADDAPRVEPSPAETKVSFAVADAAADSIAFEPLDAHNMAMSAGIDDDSDISEIIIPIAPANETESSKHSDAKPLTSGAVVHLSAPWYANLTFDDMIREIITALAFIIGVASVVRAGLSSGEENVRVADDPSLRGLCGVQGLASIAGLLIAAQTTRTRTIGLPALALLADAAAHTALLLRMIVSFVEERHSAAARQYRQRLVLWSVWLDIRAHLATVAAIVTWSTLSLALILFVLVSMGGASLWPWAWWGSHAVLSVVVLTLALLHRPQFPHPSTPPTLLLLCNVIAGFAHVAGSSMGGARVDLVTPALILLEAVRGWLLSETSTEAKSSAATGIHGVKNYHGPIGVLEKQLMATLQGNQDLRDFEQHLSAERRACILYCYQDINSCENSPSRDIMQEKYRTWRAQFIKERAPFRIPCSLRVAAQLDENGQDGKDSLCPQATAHRAKQALVGDLRAPYARFLARKRRSFSAGNIGDSQTNLLSFLWCKSKRDDHSAIV